MAGPAQTRKAPDIANVAPNCAKIGRIGETTCSARVTSAQSVDAAVALKFVKTAD
jgi:hypothetical protein